MSKKDDKQNDELEKKLKEIIQQKTGLTGVSSEGELPDQPISQDQNEDSDGMQTLKDKIAQLEKEKSELTEMAKRAQYDYLNLKMDFDRFIRQTDEKNQTITLDTLIEVVKKFLPFLEDLRKSLENITDEHMQDPLTKGVQIVYDNFLKTLNAMNIYPIESLGQTPDGLYHEPVSVLATQDEQLKGKIIQEFSRGFYYKKDGEVKVITTSKVVISS